MPKDVPPTQPAAVISAHALRTLAGMAAFANAQAELAGRYVQGHLLPSCPLQVVQSAQD